MMRGSYSLIKYSNNGDAVLLKYCSNDDSVLFDKNQNIARKLVFLFCKINKIQVLNKG